MSGVERLDVEIIVNLHQYPTRRFTSLQALRDWRKGTGEGLVVRMVTFTGVGRGLGLTKDFQDGDTSGMLFDHGGVLGFSASGDTSIELLETALAWYDGKDWLVP